MFLIFGLGPNKIEQKIDTKPTHCNRCNNETKWLYVKKTSWFSLFFLPVIPIQTRYYKSCPICREKYRIEKIEYTRK